MKGRECHVDIRIRDILNRKDYQPYQPYTSIIIEAILSGLWHEAYADLTAFLREQLPNRKEDPLITELARLIESLGSGILEVQLPTADEPTEADNYVSRSRHGLLFQPDEAKTRSFYR